MKRFCMRQVTTLACLPPTRNRSRDSTTVVTVCGLLAVDDMEIFSMRMLVFAGFDPELHYAHCECPVVFRDTLLGAATTLLFRKENFCYATSAHGRTSRRSHCPGKKSLRCRRLTASLRSWWRWRMRVPRAPASRLQGPFTSWPGGATSPTPRRTSPPSTSSSPAA